MVRDKTDRVLGQIRGRRQRPDMVVPIAKDMVLPNLSGISSHPEAKESFGKWSKIIYIEDPSSSDVYPIAMIANNFRFLKVRYITDSGTVTFNINVRSGTDPFSSSTDIWDSDKTAGTTSSDRTTFDNEWFNGERIFFVETSATTGTPTKLLIQITGELI